MNLCIKIFCAALFLLSTVSYSQDCEANLLISTDIENVNIFIDNNLVGNSRQFETMLSKGIHTVYVIENSDRWDSQSFTDSIFVNDCRDIHLDYNFSSRVFLNTDPADAYVFSNDSLIGYTPLFIPAGVNGLRLVKDGYKTKSVDYSDFGVGNRVKLDFLGTENNGSFFDKTLFKILAGSMIILGAVTAYYKLEADDSFEEYEITGDPMLLDRTDKFDTISGITFAAFQINFGALLYFFLVD